MNSLTALLLAALTMVGCESKTPQTETPSKPTTAIEMTLAATSATSATVDITLTEADGGYYLLCKAEQTPPVLSQMMTGTAISGSERVVFDALESGTSYTLYGVAHKSSIYTGIGSLGITTQGEKDYNYPEQVVAYQTTADKKLLFVESQPQSVAELKDDAVEISLNPATRYQTMEGFGPAITGSTAYNLLQMSASDRQKLLRSAFHPTEGVGYNYVRISIGCSDFSLDEYSWCDTPGLENFAPHPYDQRDLFPILDEILAINPDVKIIAAPWSAPLWMKIGRYDNNAYNKWTGGRLNPDHYATYADYLVMWVQEMERRGYKIESITPQNEPLHDGNSASTYMTWEQQRNFIKNHLGPAMREAGLTTKLWIYDHNFDVTDYVTNIYSDKQAAEYIDGSAWHAYGGSYTALAKVHSAAPDKHIYFTEQSIGTWCPNFGDNLIWHLEQVFLGTINNYCRAVVLWNFMLDENRGPNRPGGCTTCYGFVDFTSTSRGLAGLTYRSHWYATAHLSKVVQRGAYRIGSSGSASGLVHTAFLNPDGTESLVVLNSSSSERQIAVRSDRGDYCITLPARSVTSLSW